MNPYADEKFYTDCYLLGRKPVICTGFLFYARQASQMMHQHIFNRLKEVSEPPEAVRMCCCEIAEKLYQRDQLTENNGGVLMESYSNDGESGSFKAEEYTDESIRKAVRRILYKWLSDTGLLYCGVQG